MLKIGCPAPLFDAGVVGDPQRIRVINGLIDSVVAGSPNSFAAETSDVSCRNGRPVEEGENPVTAMIACTGRGRAPRSSGASSLGRWPPMVDSASRAWPRQPTSDCARFRCAISAARVAEHAVSRLGGPAKQSGQCPKALRPSWLGGLLAPGQLSRRRVTIDAPSIPRGRSMSSPATYTLWSGCRGTGSAGRTS